MDDFYLPMRYHKLLSRMSNEDRLWLYDAIIGKMLGTDPEEIDTFGYATYCSIMPNILHESSRINNVAGRMTSKYYRWRKDVLKRDNNACALCGKTGKGLVTHHVKPYKDFPKLRTELSNGITLCKSCHKKEHKKLKQEKND